jgi:hypothetical protein
VKLRKGGIDEHTTCGQHLESQRYLQDIVDLLVALDDTVCIVSLKKANPLCGAIAPHLFVAPWPSDAPTAQATTMMRFS